MKMLKCFSLFIDIGRERWDTCNRGIATYIDHFLSFYSSVEVDLTLFCEDNFQKTIEDAIARVPNFRSRVAFETIKREDLVYFSRLEEIKNIQESDIMKFAVRNYAANTPEYVRPEYVATMFSKPNILRLAKDRNLIPSDSKSIGWIDFGIAHNQPAFISRVRGKSLVEIPNLEKILLFNRKDSMPPGWAPDFFNIPENVFVPGGFFVVPVGLVDVFFEEFNKIVDQQLFRNSLVDDDQTVLSVIANNSSICEVSSSVKWRNNPPEGDWFPVFDFLQDPKEASDYAK